MTVTLAATWIDIGPLDAIPRNGARVLKTAMECVAVFRTASDEVYGLRDQCPHKQGPLSQGIVHGHFVTCPLHSWVFDLRTGAVEGPDEGSTPAYPVRVEQGRILLDIAALAGPASA